MTRSFCACCIGLLVLASAQAQQPQPGTSPVAVQGARPNNVLKPVPAEGANFRHALASPTAPQIPRSCSSVYRQSAAPMLAPTTPVRVLA